MIEPTLKITKSWRTPATDYPLVSRGDASICRSHYPRGTYLMEGVDGHLFWSTHYRIPLTTLEIKGQTVMTDGPVDWTGMQRLAEHSSGRVLVIGMGLGLVVHALLENPDVDTVDVVEINEDVAKLVEGLIRSQRPNAKNSLNVHVANGFDWKGEYDTVIVDILVKTQGQEQAFAAGTNLVLDPQIIFLRLASQFPMAKIFQWGIRNEKQNPAIKEADAVKSLWRTFK
jgi:hypothetical protein